jgi:hypothetical protein
MADAINLHIRKWTPRVQILASIITLLTGAYAGYRAFFYTEDCDVKLGNWVISFTVLESERKAYIGDEMTYSMTMKKEDNKFVFDGEQSKYRGKKNISHRCFSGKVTCEDDSLSLNYVWKKSDVKGDGSRDISGTIKIPNDPKASLLNGRFEHFFSNQKGQVRIEIQ